MSKSPENMKLPASAIEFVNPTSEKRLSRRFVINFSQKIKSLLLEVRGLLRTKGGVDGNRLTVD
jgi:hypothetical protein